MKHSISYKKSAWFPASEAVRLTSHLFVSALMRVVTGEGGFATIVRKGSSEAGAIYIVVRPRVGAVQLYGPAPQHLYAENRPSDRLFVHVETVATDEEIAQFIERESRFDSDLWLLELETNQSTLPFEIMTL